MIVLRLLGRAALRILPVLAGVSVLAFALVHLIPGDPAVVAAGLEASPATVERIRRDLGLDRSLPRQFADFAARVVRGDLGVSIRTGRPVGAEIAERLPHTAILTLGAVGLAVVLGMSAGLLAAVTRRPTLDRALMAVSLVAVSTPSFWLALMLMLVFSVALGWLPAIGVGTPAHYVLPVVTLGLQSGGQIARMTRATMIDVLGLEYLRSARARGLSRTRAIWRHALPNAWPPVVGLIGLRIGGLLAGTVLVESVFAIPGIGRFMVDAVVSRDFPVIQGGVLVIAATYATVNALTDLIGLAADPRTRA